MYRYIFSCICMINIHKSFIYDLRVFIRVFSKMSFPRICLKKIFFLTHFLLAWSCLTWFRIDLRVHFSFSLSLSLDMSLPRKISIHRVFSASFQPVSAHLWELIQKYMREWRTEMRSTLSRKVEIVTQQ